MKLYSRSQGQGSNLISIHGLFGSLENLGGINRRLAESYCVHGIDVRNHGRSQHTSSMSYSEMAADLIEYMDDQSIGQAHLLGHSMGGKIVMEAVLHYPERVRKVAVLDIAPVTYNVRRHDDVFAGLKAINLQALTKRNDADALLAQYIPEVDIRQFLLKNLYRKQDGMFDWRMNLAVIEQSYEAILSGQQTETPFSGDILFLKGSDSDYILPEHRDEVVRLFPKARLRSIHGTGHWLHAEKPDLVTNALIRFFEE
ncbi:acyl-CoA esterase [Endozoicomonas montiporae]|uniref:Acyl-CoA esterase n=2 Tax=Endozoicomonas montiporae TaxID=1027273 RepID=A0A081N8H1_9GAMM|nr:alpha/beta fold hydrolase [Endozoicomonas montiporae]AMO55360.1 alpha/beta fold superfamily hydrolase [Endozoicomonas montiporae CL-33]KEQ14744.1 acyl-CoA esterase [Endozoicomonas montiporae]